MSPTSSPSSSPSLPPTSPPSTSPAPADTPVQTSIDLVLGRLQELDLKLDDNHELLCRSISKLKKLESRTDSTSASARLIQGQIEYRDSLGTSRGRLLDKYEQAKGQLAGLEQRQQAAREVAETGEQAQPKTRRKKKKASQSSAKLLAKIKKASVREAAEVEEILFGGPRPAPPVGQTIVQPSGAGVDEEDSDSSVEIITFK